MAGINLYRERIKRIDKSNNLAECPVCGEKDNWKNVLLCEKKTRTKKKNGKKIQKQKSRRQNNIKMRKDKKKESCKKC